LGGFTKSITPVGVGFRLFEKPVGLWSRGGLMAAWQLAGIGSTNKDDQCTNNASSIKGVINNCFGPICMPKQ
jgi:hypothetical protein